MPRTSKNQVTFRLSVDDPNATKLDDVIESLTRAGFEVTPEGRRGVSVTGSRELAETVFQSSIDFEGDSPRFTSDPKADIFPRSLHYRVFFPTKPTFF
jgi:hypothetical protein